MIGFEQQDFHSTLSSTKVTHKFTQETCTHRVVSVYPALSQKLPFCSFLLSLSHSLCDSLSYFFSPFLFLSLSPLSLHPCIPFFWLTVFYFQASVLVQRDGSWERPCYHCWDSHSLSLFILPPFFFYSVLSSPTAFTAPPSFKSCILLLSLYFLLPFFPPFYLQF